MIIRLCFYAKGGCEWVKNGKTHRSDGRPAIISSSGRVFWFYENNEEVKHYEKH